MRRGLTWLAILVLVPTLVAGLALGLILGTERGNRWLLQQGVTWVPGELTIRNSQGTLPGGLRLDGLRYRNDGMALELEQLRLTLNLTALLHGTLALEELTGRGLTLTLPAADADQPAGEAAPEPGDWPAIRLPLAVALPSATLRDIHIRQGDTSHRLTRIALNGRARGQRLDLQYLQVQQGQRQLTLSGRLTFATPWQLDTRLAWSTPLPDDLAQQLGRPLAYGRARLRGNLDTLRVDHRLHQPRPLRSRGTLNPLAQPLTLDLTHEWPALALTLPDGRPLELAAGSLLTRGSPDDYRLELEAGASQLAELPALRPRLRANGDMNGLQLEEAVLEGAPGRLQASGAVAWRPRLDWSLTLTGRNLDPAFINPELPGSLDLDAQLDGALPADGPLSLELALSRLEGQLREETFTARGRLSMTGTDGMTVHALQVESRHGRADATGTLAWQPQLQWDLDLSGRGLNPAVLEARLPGDLNLDARVAGALPKDAPPELMLALTRLDGTLRDQPVTGDGDLHLRGREQADSDLRLALGDARLTLKGHWGDRPDLQATLQAPSLQQLWPDLSGQLDLEATVTGRRDRPRLDGRATGTNLTLAELALGELTLEVDDAGQDAAMTLTLAARDLRRDGQTLLAALDAEGRGHADAHQLQWTLQRANHELSGEMRGGLTEARWQGDIEALQLSGPLSETWQLEAPSGLTLSTTSLQLDPLCLAAETQATGRLCAEGHWRAGGDAAGDISLAAVPLAPLTLLLPRQPRLEGRLDGQASFQQENGRLSGRATLNADGGALILESAEEDDTLRLPWRLLRLEAGLEDGVLRGNSRLELTETGYLDGSLETHLDKPGRPVTARLDTRLEEMQWLELLVPRVRAPTGRLAGTLTVDGSLDAPQFGGELTLRDGGAEIPEAGIALRDMTLTARAGTDGILRIDGGAQSGEGQMTLDGRLDTNSPWPWPLRLTVRGEQFLALDRPDARVVLTPDLQLTINGRRLGVRGDIRVPEARLRPRQLPRQAVSVSPDVHIIREGDEEAPDAVWETDIRVAIHLGQQVSLEGFGLDARFSGKVELEDRPARVPRMTGEVTIDEGRYRAWGQHLRIERGRLLFQGAPDNPGLDIIAVRPLPGRETRVGLEVGGTLQDPRPRVFSEPPLEESQAMALLLTGRPLSGASEGEANAIIQAAAMYGLRRGDFITDPLGDTLGVEVGVDTDQQTDQAALTLGKQLSSRLYLRYSMGLFESLSTVMLRYSLTRHLNLETRSSSQSQGVDLIYRLEVD